MGRFALVIGVDRYDKDKAITNLPAAVADINAVETVLRERGEFEVKTVRNPDKQTMERELEDLFDSQRRSRKDTVLVYFSGHGFTDDHTERLYLATTDSETRRPDSSAVNASLLQQHAAQNGAGTKLLFLDCCYAAIAGDGLRARSSRRPVRKQLECTGTVVLTATGRTSASFEDTKAIGEPSYFTRAVVAGLSGNAADRDGDGWISVQDLADYVQHSEEVHGIQRPQLFCNGVNGDIPLTKTGSHHPPAPMSPAAAGRPAAVEPEHPRTAPLDIDTWKRLLRYYGECVRRNAGLSDWIKPTERGRYGFWPGGPEQLFSGPGGPHVLPPQLRRLVADPDDEDSQVYYGYPVVVRKHTTEQFAPLLMAPLLADPDGGVTAGQLEFNPIVMEHLGLEAPEVAEIAEKFRAEFRPGDPDLLAEQLKQLAGRIGADTPFPPEPARLLEKMRGGLLAPGIHNLAVVYRTDSSKSAVKGLVKDLTNGERHAMKHVRTFSSTALGALMDGDHRIATNPYQLVAPGPLNESQEAVIDAAMTRKLTVATGPPGTGKTALVAALVATVACNGESILIGSTNNEAVDNVKQEADKIVPGLVIRTGNQEHLAAEPEALRTVLAQTGRTAEDEHLVKGDLCDVQKQVDSFRKELDRRHDLEGDLLAIHEAMERATAVCDGRERVLAVLEANDRVLDRAAMLARNSLQHSITGFFSRWRLRRRFGIADIVDRQAATELFELEADRRGLAGRHAKLRDESEVWEALKQQLRQRETLSNRLTRAVMNRLITSGMPKIQQRITVMADPRKSWTGFKQLLPHLPGWAGTGHSANNIPPTPGLFDLVVIDEAAQCQVSDVLTLLMRAKRALIIGDPNQLQPFQRLGGGEDAHVRRYHRLGDEWMEDRALRFTGESIYSACVAATGEEFLLDEHYRCDPAIIAVPNRVVYQNRLAVLTDVSRLAVPAHPPEQSAVSVHDVDGKPVRRGGSWENPQEAEQVVALAASLRSTHPEATVGIVTPFSAQSKLIDTHLEAHGLKGRVRVGTAHRFQGGEKDIMIVSAVGSPGVVGRPAEWLDTQINLWNVAITRAKSRLIICCHREWWSRRSNLFTEIIGAAGAETLATEIPDELVDRLQSALRAAGLPITKRNTVIDGQPCHLLIPGSPEPVAMVVDPGNLSGGKQLRQLLASLDLIEGSGHRAVRVPAWRLLAEPDAVTGALER